MKGYDALNKANKLMNFMQTSPKKDVFSNVEDVHLAYDGKHYGIVRENSKYVLKVSDAINPTSAEDFDYIAGLQNKSKYTRNSINEVKKMFNLMNIEFSRVYGKSLMNEALEEKKYVLKGKKKTEQPIPEEPIETPQEDEITSDEDEISMDKPVDSEETSVNPEDYKDVDPDDLDTDDPEKRIQKLSGKLAYELREFDNEDDYSDTAKFAMSMVTSALQDEYISDEDKNDIEKKLDAKLDQSSNEDESNSEEDEEISLENALVEKYTRKNLVESNGSMKYWAKRLAGFYRRGEKDVMELLQIIKNNIESHDVEVDMYELRKKFMDNTKEGEEISAGAINKTVEDMLNKTDEIDLDEEVYFEVDEGLYMEDNLNIYDVDDEKILFDVDEGEDVFEIDLDEEVYSQNPKKIKNNKYAQDYFGMDVGRVVGDDDANNYILELDDDTTEKRNPFKYK